MKTMGDDGDNNGKWNFIVNNSVWTVTITQSTVLIYLFWPYHGSLFPDFVLLLQFLFLLLNGGSKKSRGI